MDDGPEGKHLEGDLNTQKKHVSFRFSPENEGYYTFRVKVMTDIGLRSPLFTHIKTVFIYLQLHFHLHLPLLK